MSTASWLAISPAAAPPMPSHTAKSDAVRADGTGAVGFEEAARRLVRSATRKLSSLCSRICPTSVLPKTSMVMSGGLGIGIGSLVRGRLLYFASSWLEPQEFISEPDEIPPRSVWGARSRMKVPFELPRSSRRPRVARSEIWACRRDMNSSSEKTMSACSRPKMTSGRLRW